MPTSDTGIWIEDVTGEVVYEQPRGGSTQIVRKGGEITAAARARLEANGTPLPPEDEPAEDGGDTDKTVTTDDLAPAKKTAKRATKKK